MVVDDEARSKRNQNSSSQARLYSISVAMSIVVLDSSLLAMVAYYRIRLG